MSDEPKPEDLEGLTEEQFCYYMLRKLRLLHDKHAKQYYDRLAKLKMREMPTHFIPKDSHESQSRNREIRQGE